MFHAKPYKKMRFLVVKKNTSHFVKNIKHIF